MRLEETVAAGECARIPLPKKARYNTKLLLAVANGVAFSPLAEGDTLIYENTTNEAQTVEIFVSKWDLGKIAALKNSEIVRFYKFCPPNSGKGAFSFGNLRQITTSAIASINAVVAQPTG